MIRSLAISVLVSGCAIRVDYIDSVCKADSDCGLNQVCFPSQGCGDPGGGLVVEVQGDTRIGQFAQDYAIGDAGFSPVINFAYLPATMTGEFRRDSLSYQNAVTVRARGESSLIPGVIRSYRTTFTSPERGTYSLPVGAGRYVVTAEPLDPSIPPSQAAGDDGGTVSITPGTTTAVSFTFGGAEKVLVVTGRLLKRIDLGPMTEVPVGYPMNIQAFDKGTLRPLSQRVQVTSSGDFSLFVAAEARKLAVFVVVATPREWNSLIPSKTFEIVVPIDPQLRLQMGEFGDPLIQMRGELRSSLGRPVVGASVYLEGPVNGGGIFRSTVVTTDAEGVFRVDLLPSAGASDAAYLLTALPPSNSPAGLWQTKMKAISTVGQPPYLQLLGAPVGVATVFCPDKITVIGSVELPGGGPAGGTRIIARAIDPLKELAEQYVPIGVSEAVADENGRFSFELNPAIYQIDFIPAVGLPRASRVVPIRKESNSYIDGGFLSATVDLKVFELRNGRTVSGTVTAPRPVTGAVQLAVNATVRYFRVSAVGGEPTSLLLGEAITDGEGNYSVILPTK